MQPNDTYNWHRSLGWGQKGFGSRLIGEIRKIRENRDNARADLLEGGTGRILCDLLRLCFRFLFCFILERPFQAIDFASRHFLLFFPRRRKCGKVCQWNWSCCAAVSALSTVLFKAPPADDNLRLANGKGNELKFYTKMELSWYSNSYGRWHSWYVRVCGIKLVSHTRSVYNLMNWSGKRPLCWLQYLVNFSNWLHWFLHLPRCVYATSHKYAHYVCQTHPHTPENTTQHTPYIHMQILWLKGTGQ